MTTTTNTQATETTTTKATKAEKAKIIYPFRTKNEIRSMLETNLDFCKVCLTLIYSFQTEEEQEIDTTFIKNGEGFMNSHEKMGSFLAKKINAGEELTAEEMNKTRAIALRYTRQIAEYDRNREMAKNPELAAVAKVFGL